MIYYVDVDNTLCMTRGMDYAGAVKISSKIAKVNKLFNAGHTVVIWTSRGMGIKAADPGAFGRKQEIRELTRKQLKDWGVKYTMLRLDKPIFDTLFDDKAENL